MSILFIFLSFLISISISALSIPKIILIAYRKRLFDCLQCRKIHHTLIPRLGGAAFIISIIIATSVTIGIILHTEKVEMDSVPLLIGLCSVLILGFTGIADDLVTLKYKNKFIIQFLVALLTVSSGVYIDNFYGLFSIQQIPLWIAFPFSVLFIVYVINSINLIDGIDGLASGICGIAFAVLGVLFLQQHQIIYAVVSFSSMGMLIPFFYYNVLAKDKYKIFMGDSGSLTIGYILVFLLIKFSNGQSLQGTEVCPCTEIIAVSLILIPILDVLRVMFCRLRKHVNIFLPDTNHIHHKFLAAGFSPRGSMFLLLIDGLVLTIINSTLAREVNINVILLLDIMLYAALNVYLSRKAKEIRKVSQYIGS